VFAAPGEEEHGDHEERREETGSHADRTIPSKVRVPRRGERAHADIATVADVSDREERLALNEAANRAINEVREPDGAGSGHETFTAVCECAEPVCDRTFEVTVDEYERVRDDPRRFMVVEEHVQPDIEDVVERRDAYVVVLKGEGAAAEIAIQEDPRG
jgi:hypothetical protein